MLENYLFIRVKHDKVYKARRKRFFFGIKDSPAVVVGDEAEKGKKEEGKRFPRVRKERIKKNVKIKQ